MPNLEKSSPLASYFFHFSSRIVRFLFEFDELNFEKGSEFSVSRDFLARHRQSLGIPFQAVGLDNRMSFRYDVRIEAKEKTSICQKADC